MALKDKLPVSYLLFTCKGRINRLTYFTVSIFIWTSFYVLFNILTYLIAYTATWLIYPVLFWTLIATAVKRLHDSNKSFHYLWLALIPVLGILILIYILALKKGNIYSNAYGAVPGSAPDYFKNGMAEGIAHLKTGEKIINDVTQLNPILVSQVDTPATIEELQLIIKNSNKPVSIGGGRFSMGGQTASSNSIHMICES